MARRGKIIGSHVADENHRVLTVVSEGGKHAYRREPCQECPWRKDSPIGAFPAEAYRHSSRTCTDMAQTTFSCHMSGAEKPATCAGFLLSVSAEHNFVVRLALMRGDLDLDKVRSNVPLYASYREMAIANGVDPADPCLKDIRE